MALVVETNKLYSCMLALPFDKLVLVHSSAENSVIFLYKTGDFLGDQDLYYFSSFQ